MAAPTGDGGSTWHGALLAVFLIVVIGVGAVIGAATAPGDWYAALEKPAFNPPDQVFAPVWLTLYVMIAIAGWRTFIRARSSGAMKLWYAQMLLNWSWSPVFFTLHMPWLAFVVIVGMFAVIIAFIAATRRRDPVSAWLFVPYSAWVGFASVLNLAIAILNQRPRSGI